MEDGFGKGNRAGVLDQRTLAYDASHLLVYIADMYEKTQQILLHRGAFSTIWLLLISLF